MNTRLKLLAVGSFLSMALAASCVQADTVVVTIGELDTAIDNLDANPDALQRMVLEGIEKELGDANLQLSEGELIFSETSENLTDDDSCTRTDVRSMTTTAVLASATTLSFSLDSLNDPIDIDLDVAARVNSTGRAKLTLGFRLGRCQELARDYFSFDASGDFELSLNLRLELNPELDSDKQQLLLRPVIALSGSLQSSNVEADVDDSILRAALERLIEKEIDNALDESEIVSSIERLQARLQESLNREMEDGVIKVELPAPDDEQISRLYALLSPDGDFSLSLGYLRERRVELMAALVTGDDAAVDKLLGNAALCQAAGLLQTDMSHPAVYLPGEDGCAAVSLNSNSASSLDRLLYKDSQCQSSFDYQASTDNDYCNYVLHNEKLGNGAANPETLNRWTLSTGTRFDIGALPLAGVEQPFTQRLAYKQVSTAQGECSLEMRIHTAHPGAVQPSDLAAASQQAAGKLRPLIAFHGGSWQRRSTGALGIEAMAAQFTSRGFVVFVPFYRLIDTDEGTYACNNASLSDVLDDANDALDWVGDNAELYGASGKPVVFGQSAGGHLSAVLAVERPDDVASAVLFYAPTDFENFANQIRNGEIDGAVGQRILETVVKQTLDTLNINDPLVQRNTLTKRIVNDAIDTPPFFLLHGMKDDILPFNQSVRFCDALSGNPDAGAAATAVANNSADPFRRVVACGTDGSELHLLSEGEHALDLCIAEELCLAGSPQSALKTADSVQQMLNWLGMAGSEKAPEPVIVAAVNTAPPVNDDVSLPDQNAQMIPDNSPFDVIAADTDMAGSTTTALNELTNDTAPKSSGSVSMLALLLMSVCAFAGRITRRRQVVFER